MGPGSVVRQLQDKPQLVKDRVKGQGDIITLLATLGIAGDKLSPPPQYKDSVSMIAIRRLVAISSDSPVEHV